MDGLLSKIVEFIHLIPLFPSWLRYCIYGWMLFGLVTVFISFVWYTLPGAAPARIQTHIQTRQGSMQTTEVRNKTLKELKDTVYGLQKQSLNFMQAGNYHQAAEMLRQTEPYLNEALLRDPQDIYVLNLRGYMFKDWAQVELHLGQRAEAEKLLDEAMQTFQFILKLDDKDAGAHNGLGSIYILRGKYDLAEKEIRTALELKPDYVEAQRDLELIKRLRQQGQ